MRGRYGAALSAGLLLAVYAWEASFAGPNVGGVLILHANNLPYSAEAESYCAQGGLSSCWQAVVSVGAYPEVCVFFVYAAFSEESSPRVEGLTFGIEYDEQELTLLAEGHCADFALPTEDWPDPQSGTALTWSNARTNPLTEVAWFVGYVADGKGSTSFELTAHPTQGAAFADDSVPSVLDEVSDFGRLGFGEGGYRPCPSTTDSGGYGEPEGGGAQMGSGTSGVIKAVAR